MTDPRNLTEMEKPFYTRLGAAFRSREAYAIEHGLTRGAAYGQLLYGPEDGQETFAIVTVRDKLVYTMELRNGPKTKD